MTNADFLRSQLHGVIGFPVTTFHDDLSLNMEGYRHSLGAMLQHPICAVAAAAGTGEMFSLTPEEHREVVEATVTDAAGKLPVLAATGFNTAIGTTLVENAVKAGVDGILILPPYYPTHDEEGLLNYYRTLAEAAAPLGVFIYSRDAFNPSPAFVARIAAAIPNLIAWKDGQGDVRRLQMIQAELGDRLHWIGGAGDDAIAGYYSLGIRTYTSSIATVAPRLSIALHEAASAGDHARLHELMRAFVIPMYALRARRRGYEVSVMKRFMDVIGLTGGIVRPPLADVRPDELDLIRTMATEWKDWI